MGRVNVRVLYFGQARDAAGCTQESLSLAEPASLGDILAEAARRHEKLSKITGMLQFAVNEELVEPTASVGDGDEVALLPPVVGG